MIDDMTLKRVRANASFRVKKKMNEKVSLGLRKIEKKTIPI